MKKKQTEIVMYAAIEQKIPNIKKADLKFTWHEKSRRRDPDNIAFAKKFILDGLVSAGVLENDGWNQVNSFTDEWVKSDWQGVIVEIKEC